jgi:dTDP-4-amino-4,6-dideoxygalactose transaminase
VSTSYCLAILGGAPAFAEPLHVSQPNIGDREAFLARVDSMLDRRWFTNDGPYVAELERRLADRLRVKHCVVVCNGTVALQLAVRAAGLRGEVLLPSWTFIATAHALQWEGLTPVFCDIDARTWTLSPESCEAAITSRTAAILGVHLFGEPCEVMGLQAVARRHGLQLLFDAAHAFGCGYGGHPIGAFGAAEVFSFHATKAFHTFEGGGRRHGLR